MKKVSIIVPNYNGIIHLIDFFYSLKDFFNENYEVIFVDNGSIDGSLQMIKSLFPTVKLIKLNENVGFGKAVDVGIDNSSGDYIVVLNNDTMWDVDFIGEGISFLEKNGDYYFVSPLVLYRDRKRIDSAGDFISPFFSPYKILNGKRIEDLNLNEREIFFSSCSAVILRKEFFYRVGNFDEDFFMYYEDSDLFYRSFITGIKGIFLPHLILYHKEGGTSLKGGEKSKVKRHFYLFRNSFYFSYKNLPPLIFYIYFPVIFIHRFLLFLKWEKLRNISIFFKAFFEFLRNMKLLKKKRITVLKKIRVSYFKIVSEILKGKDF